MFPTLVAMILLHACMFGICNAVVTTFKSESCHVVFLNSTFIVCQKLNSVPERHKSQAPILHCIHDSSWLFWKLLLCCSRWSTGISLQPSPAVHYFCFSSDDLTHNIGMPCSHNIGMPSQYWHAIQSNYTQCIHANLPKVKFIEYFSDGWIGHWSLSEPQMRFEFDITQTWFWYSQTWFVRTMINRNPHYPTQNC